MDDKKIEELRKKAEIMPTEAGVYQFIGEGGKIIYVGKAKNIRKRLMSYFLSGRDENAKQKAMLGKARNIKAVITPNEADALLLENNLIKKYQPKYNVLLKDGKTFPWICIKKERFPRIFLTRQKVEDGSKYFGPYTSITIVNALLELIKQLYPLRSCHLQLAPDSIAKKKHSVCLEYHIGNCRGPCEGLQSERQYFDLLAQVIDIIRGNADEIAQLFKSKMDEAARRLDFEEAQSLKDAITKIEIYQSRSVVVNPAINNVDVFSLLLDNDVAYGNFLRVAKGAIVQSYTLEMKTNIEEEKDVLLGTFIAEIRRNMGELSEEIVVPFLPDIATSRATFVIPQKGDKLKLLELSERNAKAYRVERLKLLETAEPEKHYDKVLRLIQRDLRLDKLPRRIECFDNSNIQGTNPVAACVVFVNAKPAKREYRHFNVKTVVGADDFATMSEIIYRRYSRLIDENLPLPQLIVIDGGKGQLNAAVQSLEKLELVGRIPILGLAKRLEEIYFPGDDIPLHLNKNSETLKLLMHIRDEAHRFGITFHRQKRSAAFISSELSDIKGVGEASARKLMQEFKTVSAIKLLSAEEMTPVVGARIAKLIRQYFDNEKNNNPNTSQSL
ncbi:MAG: excinuclease ABC subunit UvrC [Prevotellaceae bacterium]|nr:excinuclease ABC subunit UvrC [Prevotellaceae bacterium]